MSVSFERRNGSGSLAGLVRRVLIVDDDPTTVDMISRQLSHSANRIRVDSVSSVAAAIERTGGDYDVVLADLTLPDSAGVPIIRRLASGFRGVALIALTRDEEAGLLCVSEGAQDFLAKGEVTESRLLEAVDFAVQRSRQTRQLRFEEQHDPLTGLFNQHGLTEQLPGLLSAAAGGGYGVGLMLLDVDGFRRVNDDYGHVSGDRVLVGVAGCLRALFRSDDLIVRWGGDEFVVITACRTQQLFDRLVIRAHEAPWADWIDLGQADVGVSVGAAYSESAAISVEELLEVARQNMELAPVAVAVSE